MRSLNFAFIVILASYSHLSFGVTLVPLTEPEGLQRLIRSSHKADFAKLSQHYLNQTDRIICGPVVGSIILNALRYNTPAAPLV